MVIPYGDLGGDFERHYKGFGATSGFEVGFRFRVYLTPTISLAPAFHFVNYGSFNGEDIELGDYEIRSTTYRYTLELLVMGSGAFRQPRPFFGLSGGVYRNRVNGYYKGLQDNLRASENSFGWAVRIGVRIVGFELSMVYNVNRFHSWQFFDTGYHELYNWDNLNLRAGWSIPF